MHRVSNHAAAAGSSDFLGYKKNHTEQSQARASCMNFISFTRTQITYMCGMEKTVAIRCTIASKLCCSGSSNISAGACRVL